MEWFFTELGLGTVRHWDGSNALAGAEKHIVPTPVSF